MIEPMAMWMMAIDAFALAGLIGVFLWYIVDGCRKTRTKGGR